MLLNTPRFGEIELDDRKTISFKEGLPGLEDCKSFALVVHEQSKPLSWLQAIDRPEVSLPVIDPFLIIPDYAFDVLEEDVEALEIAGEKDIHVLSVLVIPKEQEEMTINLAAPILINVKSYLGRQIYVNGYDTRQPLCELLKRSGQEVGSHAGAD